METPRECTMSSVSDSGLAGKFWNTASLNSETATRTKVCEAFRPAKTTAPSLHVHTAPPYCTPQTLRPKGAVVFTSSGSHRLQVFLAALQGTSSAPPTSPHTHREFLTGVWAGRTFRAEVLTPTGFIFEGTPHETCECKVGGKS